MYKIYRVEHINDENGPYNSDSGYKIARKLINNHNDDKHPGVKQDIDAWEWGMLSACVSLIQLKTWFRGYMSKLRDDGFGVFEYQVTGYHNSDSGLQICFNEDDVIEKKLIPYCEKKKKYLVD